MKVRIVKEVMACDVSPVAMFPFTLLFFYVECVGEGIGMDEE